jgi:hypothetical protein
MTENLDRERGGVGYGIGCANGLGDGSGRTREVSDFSNGYGNGEGWGSNTVESSYENGTGHGEGYGNPKKDDLG